MQPHNSYSYVYICTITFQGQVLLSSGKILFRSQLNFLKNIGTPYLNYMSTQLHAADPDEA